jgi:predicted ester cyclase
MLERFDSPGRSAFAFRLSGRHIGPLTTPLGEVAPTGQQLTVLGMDIFTITDDRVTEVWAVADYLSLLMQAGAASLVRT